MDTDTATAHPEKNIPSMTAFSIMFVSIGMSCFIWQSINIAVDTKRYLIQRLLFSVVGVNIADISLQFVLLWKAYLGNNRSKLILGVGCIPLVSIAAFIIVNMTFGRSISEQGVGLCETDYRE